MSLILRGAGILPVTIDAVALYADVLDGSWSAVVGHTADRIRTRDQARDDLDARAGGHCVPCEPMTVTGADADDEDTVTYTGREAALRDAYDLYSRVLAGQWRAIAQAVGRFDDAGECDRIRYRHQKAGAYPDHPGAYWSLRACPAAAVVAYDGWKALGGGITERGFAGTGVTLEREPCHLENEPWTA